VIVHVFACDYDGTIAAHGRVAEATAQTLGRVRESGRKLLLVTGRMLPDLRSVCPAADRMFDAVVAENGAVLYFPGSRETKVLGDPPEEALLEALRQRRVRFDVGASIIATDEPFAEAALAAIRHPGVVSVYALGAHQGVDYMVMEHVAGVTLAHHLEREAAGLGGAGNLDDRLIETRR